MYAGKMLNLLHDVEKYSVTSINEINVAYKRIYVVLNDLLFDGLIDLKIYKFLHVEKPRIPTVFGIPKVHKDQMDPPLRLIVAANGSVTAPLAKYIDLKIKHIIDENENILKDSWHFLSKIKPHLYDETTGFGTLDVVDLFTNIPHDTGLACGFDADNKTTACRIPEDKDVAVLSFNTIDATRTLKCVNLKKAAGPDNITGRVLRECVIQLAPVLSDIINTSLHLASVPKCFEEMTIIPLPKKPQPTTLNDYRPVALTSTVPQSLCSETCLVGFQKAIRPGHPICCFDCIPCSEGEISNHTDSTACTKCQDDHWPNSKGDACIPKPMEFLAYQDSLGLTLAAIACICALISVLVLVVFARYHDTPIVRANNRGLSYVFLLGLALCFLCSLIFIGLPTSAVCKFRQVAFGLVFVFCVSCVLSKTVIVIIAFRATKPNSNLSKWVGPQIPISTVFICMLFQIIICSVWLTVAPPFSEQNMKSQIGKISIECNEGSITAFWCMLGYMGLLSCVSFVVAFLARNLPDSFNEARFITFSMLVFVSVWLSFIPAYLSTKGKYMVAVEIFAILSSSAGLLSCIFLPKCYIILLRPELNTRGVLMGKRKYESKNE
ncbi:vomeronasal type-2 receptor 26-like [Protopterus annectens]|uniref:vomeronasal type-2 receptor 26-like n=1 Tax=Protopterus annectens TaxID=7888 RepID=UPI001CFA70D2|nr:vomeronasal type-2 receptor 26-like [Protopterus annectens]